MQSRVHASRGWSNKGLFKKWWNGTSSCKSEKKKGIQWRVYKLQWIYVGFHYILLDAYIYDEKQYLMFFFRNLYLSGNSKREVPCIFVRSGPCSDFRFQVNDLQAESFT